MNILVFDTETNGFPTGGVQPRIIQIAWQVYTPEEELLYECCSLIKPDGWTVPDKKFWIENNLSTERCEKEGNPMTMLLDIFCSDVKSYGVEIMVAHNLDFDAPILAAEMGIYGKIADRKLKKVCTMKSSAAHFGGKWPKLIELHNRLFNISFEGAHDALADVKACAKCYFELKKLGII